MKQTDYLSVGALKVALSCGALGGVDWLGRTEEYWSCFLLPTLTYRLDPTMKGHPPTRSIALAWFRWYAQISFAWDNSLVRYGVRRNSGHHRTHQA